MIVGDQPQSPATEPLPVKRENFADALLLLLIVSVFAVSYPVLFATRTQRTLRAAAVAFDQEDFHAVDRLVNQVLEAQPELPAALLLGGEAAARLHQNEQSLDYFSRVTDDGSPEAVQALYGQAERLMRLGRARAAEDRLRRTLHYWPTHVRANRMLSYLLQVQGRTWEAIAPAQQLIRVGQFNGDQLHVVGSPKLMFVSDEHFIDRCLSADPDDPLVRLRDVRRLTMANKTAEAEIILRQVLEKSSGQLEAQAQLGRLLFDASRYDEFQDWFRSLPVDTDAHPEIWFVRGLDARRRNQNSQAARCFLETLKRSPNHLEASTQLAQVLGLLNRRDDADWFGQRAANLARLETTIREIADTPELNKMQKAVELYASLGRFREAAGMCYLVVEVIRADTKWARQGLARYTPRISRNGEFIDTAFAPSERVSIEQFPLPTSDRPADIAPADSIAGTDDSAGIAFRQVNLDAGFDFTFFNGAKDPRGLEHIYETTGGGVASCDYDGDFWPDLYLVQGGPLPVDPAQTAYRDRLFRNAGGQFSDVTMLARLGHTGFGQGVTAGDFNNDGFTDLYVANLGTNRFYENNGDGTFTEITQSTGTGGNEWTLSCLIADLNGDAWPDIYAVNYLEAAAVAARSCRRNGLPLTCAPTLFPAEQDRVYVGRGDGTFEEVTQSSGVVQTDGKGLGIVAADFDGSRRLSLFIGNDTDFNFFFVNETSERGGALRFSEEALVRGLAVNGEGRPQATMGIAAGDADGDGLLDLFSTNFYADANTLFQHQAGVSFVDATRTAGLYDGSFNMLGFGTQFLDADLDGHLDLVMTNGHVDRSDATGEPDEMSPQFFRNRGGGRFVELQPESLGPFFERKFLGRALTRLDYNRDGADDFCVSHLHAPAALVENRCITPGHFLSLRLKGVLCDRDAIGTRVTVRQGNQRQTLQLTAGDGYESSNQRRLVFGLGSVSKVDEIVIHWPSGRDASFGPVDCDCEAVAVENPPILVTVSKRSEIHTNRIQTTD